MKKISLYYCDDQNSKFILNQIKKKYLKYFDFFKIGIDGEIGSQKPTKIINPDDNSILLWGDGFMHQMSHYFDPQKKFSKVIYDAHIDSSKEEEIVNYENHITHTIFKNHFLEKLYVAGYNINLYPYQEMMYVIQSRKNKLFPTSLNYLKLSNKDLSISIDFDLIKNFPCCEEWQNDGNNLFDEFEKSIESLFKNNNILRLDLGGLDLDRKNTSYNGVEDYLKIISIYLESLNQK